MHDKGHSWKSFHDRLVEIGGQDASEQFLKSCFGVLMVFGICNRVPISSVFDNDDST